MLRRGLIGAVTALAVARPLVPGEDPGRLIVGTGIADQGFTVLWLVVAAGWGIWRAWTGRGAWFGSLVEAGLLGLAAVAFGLVLGGQTTYRHPAWLIAGQWGTLLVVFCMVRQLVRSPADNRALVAAMGATAISLAVYAVYQARQPDMAISPPDATLAEIFDLPTEPTAPEGIAATFVHPATFAGFLVLLFPSLIGSALASWRVEQVTWRTGIIVACCCLCAVALFLTRSWWSIILLTLVGLFALLFRLTAGGQRGPLLLGSAGLVLIDVLVVAIAGPDRLKEFGRERWQTWETTFALIREQPWLGIGPGNFSREFLARLTSPAVAPAAEPHNFLLEVTATLGLAGLALLLATLVVFFWRMIAGIRQVAADDEGDEGQGTPWEFYLGGVAGLSLGFVLRYAELGGANALVEALVALCRSLVWFGAFAVLESVPWTGRSRALALAAGVAALLLNLLFEGGIGFPSLAQPLWIMAALTLNALPEPAPVWEGRRWIGRVLPAPILGVVCLLYLLFVFYPAAAAASAISEARLFYQGWREGYEQRWRRELNDAGQASERIRVAQKYEAMISQVFIDKLDRAVADDADNAATRAERAFWYGKQWQIHSEIGAIPNQVREQQIRIEQKGFADAATQSASQARELDPKGPEAYWVMYLLRNQFARGESGTGQRTQYRMAADNLGQMVEHDPMDAHLRFLLSEALFRGGDVAEGQVQARQALDLDEQAGPGRRRLTSSQRAQALKWVTETTVR